MPQQRLWTLPRQRLNVQTNKGEHGFDNEVMDMKTIFRAVGPSFRRGLEVEPFESVHVYELMCKLLGIVPEANDGLLSTLLPTLTAEPDGGDPSTPQPTTHSGEAPPSACTPLDTRWLRVAGPQGAACSSPSLASGHTSSPRHSCDAQPQTAYFVRPGSARGRVGGEPIKRGTLSTRGAVVCQGTDLPCEVPLQAPVPGGPSGSHPHPTPTLAHLRQTPVGRGCRRGVLLGRAVRDHRDDSEGVVATTAGGESTVGREEVRGLVGTLGVPCLPSRCWGEGHAPIPLIHWTLQLSLGSPLLPGGRSPLVTGLLVAAILLVKVA